MEVMQWVSGDVGGKHLEIDFGDFSRPFLVPVIFPDHSWFHSCFYNRNVQ